MMMLRKKRFSFILQNDASRRVTIINVNKKKGFKKSPFDDFNHLSTMSYHQTSQSRTTV